MDLPSPAQISFDPVTRELIADVDALARQVNEIRPVSPEVVAQIEQELLGPRVYYSNAVEGNTIDLRETIRILDSGEVVGVGRRREATEVVNLGAAIARVQQMVDDPKSWSDLGAFTEVHRILLTDVQNDAAGVIRSEGVMIRAAKYQPPDESHVRALLEQLFASLEAAADVESIPLATWVP